MKKAYKILGISAILTLFVSIVLELYIFISTLPNYAINLNEGASNVVCFIECIIATVVLLIHIFGGVKCLVKLFNNECTFNYFAETFVCFAFLDAIVNLAFTVCFISIKESKISDPFVIASLVIFSLTLLTCFVARYIKRESKILNTICIILFLGTAILGFFEVNNQLIGKEIIPTIEFILPIIECLSITQAIAISLFSFKNSNNL